MENECITLPLHNMILIYSYISSKNSLPSQTDNFHYIETFLIDHLLSTSHRLHQRGLRVCYQNKDISIKAKLVNPAVQFCGNINSWAEKEDKAEWQDWSN